MSVLAVSTLLLSAASVLVPTAAVPGGTSAGLASGTLAQLEVTSQSSSGAAISGIYVEVYTSLGTPLLSGYTPANFTLADGLTYQVAVSDYGGCTFAYWSDTRSTVDQRSVTMDGNAMLAAVFDCGATSTTTTSTSSTSTTTTGASTTTSSTTAAGTSSLTVGSRWANGTAISGMYAVLYQGGTQVASGYTPVQFTLTDGQPYQVEVEGYGSAYFQYWGDTNWVNALRNVTLSSPASFDAVFCKGACSDGSTAPPPSDGVTVYADRIPASYWSPCFATVCSAGTGPGASMYVVIEDSAGNVLHSAYADEWGVTFTGLTPGVTYYVLATNCNMCHGSVHDVVFNYWTGGTLGSSQYASNPLAVKAGGVVEAWYSCTNSCA